jgi:hypothetical protein
MLNIICQRLAVRNSRHCVLVGSVFFFENVREDVWSHDPAICDMLRPGNVYTGFRMMPTVFASNPVFLEGRKILMVRDPRDALVSEFFSVAYSHPVPARTGSDSPVTDMMEQARQLALNTGIDEFVTKHAGGMRDAFLGYTDDLRSTGTVVVKYEDSIFRKRPLIATIAQHFGWAVTASEVDLIMAEVDQWPATENPSAVIRQVRPGDHRNKLSAKTIAKLNDKLRPAIEAFGYPAE